MFPNTNPELEKRIRDAIALLAEHGYRVKRYDCTFCEDTGYVVAIRDALDTDGVRGAMRMVACPRRPEPGYGAGI